MTTQQDLSARVSKLADLGIIGSAPNEVRAFWDQLNALANKDYKDKPVEKEAFIQREIDNYINILSRRYFESTVGGAKADAAAEFLKAHPDVAKKVGEQTATLYGEAGKKLVGMQEKIFREIQEAFFKERTKIINEGIEGIKAPHLVEIEVSRLGIQFGYLLKGIGRIMGNDGLVVMGQDFVDRNTRDSKFHGNELLQLAHLAERHDRATTEAWDQQVQKFKLDYSAEAAKIIANSGLIFAGQGGKIGRQPLVLPRPSAPATTPAPAGGTAPAAPAAAAATAGMKVMAAEFDQPGVKKPAGNNPGNLHGNDGKPRTFSNLDEGTDALRTALTRRIDGKNITLGALMGSMYPGGSTRLNQAITTTGLKSTDKLEPVHVENLIRGISGLPKPQQSTDAGLNGDDPSIRTAGRTGGTGTDVVAAGLTGRTDFEIALLHEFNQAEATRTLKGGAGGITPGVKPSEQLLVDAGSQPEVGTENGLKAAVIGRALTKEEEAQLRNVPVYPAPTLERQA